MLAVISSTQEHLARQSAEWLQTHVTLPWTNAVGMQRLVEVGLHCTAVRREDRWDLPAVREHLAATLAMCGQDARDCMYVSTFFR